MRASVKTVGGSEADVTAAGETLTIMPLTLIQAAAIAPGSRDNRRP